MERRGREKESTERHFYGSFREFSMVLHDTFVLPREAYEVSPYESLDWVEEILREHNILEEEEVPFNVPTEMPPLALDTCGGDFADLFEETENNFIQELEGVLEDPVTVNPDAAHFPFSFDFEWTHKKGKKKPQQFWVYCEDKQHSYARVTLTSPSTNLEWNGASRAFLWRDQICLVNNYRAKALQQKSICVNYFPLEQKYMGQEQELPTAELVPVDRNHLDFEFVLESDTAKPAHPSQGNATDVTMRHDTANFEFNDLLEPFQHNAMFSFRNRVEGWFRLRITLSYRGVPLVASHSDTFMFNNPRLKKRKELSVYPPSMVKFLQMYALSDAADEHWVQLANDMGYRVTSCTLQLATSVFGRKSKKRPLQGTTPSTKRQCLQPHAQGSTSFSTRHPLGDLSITTGNTNSARQLPTEFAFTVHDPQGNIREVYSPSKSLGDLKLAIGREFDISSLASLRLFKISTGALLNKDQNILHLNLHEHIRAHWDDL